MTFDEHPITGERELKLNRWLSDHQSEVFLAVIESTADHLEATAVAEMMREPVAVIAGEDDTESVKDKLKESASLRLLVSTFRRLSKQNQFVIYKPYVSRPATADPAH